MAMTFDKEKVHFNLARLKAGDDVFEVVVDPDLAIKYQRDKEGDISEILKSEHIFADAKKGMLASEENMKARLDTADPLEIAKIILLKGEIQLSSQYREQIREEKKKKIINTIATNGIDPKTNLPHPVSRIENALEEAKIKIDEYKPADMQIDDIVKKIRTVLPIKFAVKEIEVKIPAEYAAKSYGLVKNSGKMLREEWQKDGSWLVIIEMPGGVETDFYEKINGLTHGNVETNVLKTR